MGKAAVSHAASDPCIYRSAHLRCPGNCPEGIYVSPLQSAESWNGVIFVRKGYYQGGVFRFEISFPASFPNRAPTVTFAKGSLIHPLVDVSMQRPVDEGSISTNLGHLSQSRDDRLALASAFPVWKAQSDNMSKLLYFVKGIFKTYNIERLSEGHAINAEMLR